MYDKVIPGLVSIVIPSRNEPFLEKTVRDLLDKATGQIEIIVNLDGYWPTFDDLVSDPRVIFIHRSQARGMRAGINAAVSLAKGEYILKTDAHCMFAKGFDEVLKADLEDNWIAIPRRYALDPQAWDFQKREDSKYPIDQMYLSADLHGEPWIKRRDDPQYKNRLIVDTPSSQGSCWFMKKSYFYELELLDEENYGTFYNEFQEIGLKCWLSGGRIIVNKNTWYAHWHKTSDFGRGYSLDKGEKEKAAQFLKNWQEGKGWHKQTKPLSYLLELFPDMPGWEHEKKESRDQV